MHLPAFSSRRLIAPTATAGAVTLGSLAALAASASFAATASFASHAAITTSTPPCATADLVVWLDTRGNGAAGSTYYKLEFTNQSGHPCRLGGFPGVSAVDLGGAQLGSAASRDGSRGPRTVRLAGGATATAVLRIVEARNFPRSGCRPVSAAGFRVYPPNGTASKVVPFPFAACSRTGLVYLSVQPVRAA